MLSGLKDDFFGATPSIPEGPGSVDMSVGESMFDTMGKPPSFAPSPQDMARAMEDVRVRRKVELKEVVSRTYDLSDEADRTQYTVDLEHIMLGESLKTHMLLEKPPKQFVCDENGARYIAYMEWVEFRLVEKPVPVTGE